MDPFKTLAFDIIDKLNANDLKDINSYLGFINLSCKVVEETTKKSKIKINPEYKRQLAIDISEHLCDKLLKDKVISQELGYIIKDIIENTSYEDIKNIIDDIIGIWKDVKKKASIFCPCLKKKNKTKVQLSLV